MFQLYEKQEREENKILEWCIFNNLFFILNEPRREVVRTFSGKIAITRRFGRKIKGFIIESKLYTWFVRLCQIKCTF